MSLPLARLDDPRYRSLAVVVALGAAVATASVAVTAVHGLGDRSSTHLAAAFALFIAFGELARVTLPGERDAAPVGAAGALGYALLPTFAGHAVHYAAAQVVAVTAVAVVVGGVPHVAAGRPPQLDVLARRILTIGFAAAALRSTPLYDWSLGLPKSALALVLLSIVALTSVVDAVLATAVRAGRDRAPFRPVFADELRAQLGIGTAIGATGVLIALAADLMHYWALPVFVAPLLLAQFSFRRYAAIRSTYLQTIKSLSRVTEIGGYTETGHSRRVSQISVAVGRELGMGEGDLLDLEYAALMHDLGQLSLTDPIPGGATVVAAPAEQRRIAGLGAEVIRQTGVLDRVATIVEQQAEPYRRGHQVTDADVPLASRIIKAVNAFDDLVGDSPEMSRQLEALERLRLGMAYEYDPRVVESLTRVIERFSRLGS